MDEIQRPGNNVNNIEYRNTGDLVEDVKLIIDSAQRSAHQAVNVALVVRNWLLGKRIAEEELGDDTRQELYGRKVVAALAEELTRAYGKGYTKRSLYQYVQFYRMFPEIVQMPTTQSFPRLSWSHYVELIRVRNPEARAWYEQEAVSQGWSVKQLSRNISSQYCERMLSNQVRPSHKDAAVPSETVERAERLAYIKSPMVMDFLGLSADPHIHESDLESAILDNLQQFMLELGKGYAFVSRQQHLRTEWDDYFIDLVFYNYLLHCFVLIDLKTSKITHQDVGQMDMYVRMYDDLRRSEGDGPTLGIVLCAETDEDIARYSVMHDNEQLFMSKYKLYLPKEEELRAEIEAQKRVFRAQHGGDWDTRG